MEIAKWEVVVGHYGKLLILRFLDKEQAENTFELISTAVTEWSDYKNDRKPTIRVTDDIGVHVIVTSETKSVSMIEIEPAIRGNIAFEEHFRAIKNGEAEPASEDQGAEVSLSEPEA